MRRSSCRGIVEGVGDVQNFAASASDGVTCGAIEPTTMRRAGVVKQRIDEVEAGTRNATLHDWPVMRSVSRRSVYQRTRSSRR